VRGIQGRLPAADKKRCHVRVRCPGPVPISLARLRWTLPGVMLATLLSMLDTTIAGTRVVLLGGAIAGACRED